VRHGGTITCKSILGQETLFRVELPGSPVANPS